MTSGGKGDKRRPQQITDEEFSNNWDRIFNKKETKILKGTAKAMKDAGLMLEEDEERIMEDLASMNEGSDKDDLS